MGFFDFLFPSSGTRNLSTSLYFFNTLTKEKERFTLPPMTKQVRMYNCGPTVYGRQHIGNLSAAVFADILRRTLELNGYSVKQVINITDFGHLTSDGDDGEDKMAKGLKKEGMKFSMENMHELATKYMNLYLEDIRLLEIDTKKILFPRASEHVAGMVAMIRTLEEKSYAYLTSDGIYFDTARFQNYGALGGIDTTTLQEGARVAANPEKHNPSDFALWKFNKKMGWDSPWGKGFPGWHMECSAMINAILGKQIDIHTGGIEHISVHHNNEIAQSEAATGKKPLARFWLHRAHIQMDNQKLAKSSGNVAYLSDLTDRGIHPLSLRYWFLTSHYRQPSNFTWQALEAAQTAHVRLHERMQSLSPEPESNPPSSFKTSFIERMNDDMDTPGALALLWETVKDSKFTPAEIKAAISFADKALGLRLTNPDENLMKLLKPETQVVDIAAVSDEVRALLEARQKARDEKDWTKADSIRVDLLSQGFSVRDSADGPVLEKTKQ